MKRKASRGVIIDKGAPDFVAALLGTSFNAQDPGRRPDCPPSAFNRQIGCIK